MHKRYGWLSNRAKTFYELINVIQICALLGVRANLNIDNIFAGLFLKIFITRSKEMSTNKSKFVLHVWNWGLKYLGL